MRRLKTITVLFVLAGVPAACQQTPVAAYDQASQAVVSGTVSTQTTPLQGAVVRVVALRDSTCVQPDTFSDTVSATTDALGAFRVLLRGPSLKLRVCIHVRVTPPLGSGLLETSRMLPNAIVMDLRQQPDSVAITIRY